MTEHIFHFQGLFSKCRANTGKYCPPWQDSCFLSKAFVYFTKYGYSQISDVKHCEIKICRFIARAASALRRQWCNECCASTSHVRHRATAHLIACRATIQTTTRFRRGISSNRCQTKRPAIAIAIHHRRVAKGSTRKIDASAASRCVCFHPRGKSSFTTRPWLGQNNLWLTARRHARIVCQLRERK